MKPEDKVEVVQIFQKNGFVVGMCGDGGNFKFSSMHS